MSLVKRNTNGNRLPGMSNLFEDFLTRDLFDWSNSNFSPTNTTLTAVNIKETEKSFEVEMAAPGIQKDNFRVELDNNLLTISSEKQEQYEEKEGEKFTKREFSYQSFQRSFTLPEGLVDEDKIQAKYTDGVLHLTIPKSEKAKKKLARTIKIS